MPNPHQYRIDLKNGPADDDKGRALLFALLLEIVGGPWTPLDTCVSRHRQRQFLWVVILCETQPDESHPRVKHIERID